MDTLSAALARHRRAIPELVALADEHREVRYGELQDQIDSRREQLANRRARVVAIELDNCVDWVLWDLAAAAGEITCVPIPPFFTDAQRAHIFGNTGIDTVISPAGLVAVDHPRVALPGGTAKITFTSGTTGAPKGVCLPWAGLQGVAASILDAVGTGSYKRHFAAMPLAILLENVAGVYSALFAGCRIELRSRANQWTDPRSLLETLSETRANTVILVPELLRGLAALMAQTGSQLPDLEFVAVGGSRVSPELIVRSRELGLPVYEGYGLSECGSVVSLNTPRHDRPGTVGRPLPHVNLAIENGEIVVSNPVSLGYVGGIGEGTLRTGDIGECDEDGFLSVKGRSKNVLITSYGRNISPEWPETELTSNPGIVQAVVCGDGWPQPGALIVAEPTAKDTAIDRAVAATNAALPEYARIAGWLRVEPFTPQNGLLTGTGRPRRECITEIYLEKLESEMKKTEFYDHLVEATAAAREALYSVPQLVDGLNGHINRDAYIAYLTEAYHHVRHTVPFLMSMGARLPRDKLWLQEAIIEYINEEKGHEQWILSDIDAAGGDAESARESTPNLETQVLVAYNYDYIRRKNPVGFLGMVFMLESTSTQIAIRGASSIQSVLDLPDKAFSYLFSHGALDQEHMRFFRILVNRVTDPEDQAAIVEVARNTFRLFAGVLGSIPHDVEVRHVA